MSRLSQEARVNKLFEAVNRDSKGVQIIDCSNAKESLLKQLEVSGSFDHDDTTSIDQDMVTNLRNALQDQIRRSEQTYNVRYVSKK